ncbi:hypothetical protein Scep_023873 [Stephania cephalantha]|uniref:Uncharacterized protein n=1 Tax=Stephania cephalantha TaxID=152367 RepID=A0AAP0F0Y8_9MAGN
MNLEPTSFLDGDIKLSSVVCQQMLDAYDRVFAAMEQKELLEELAESYASTEGRHSKPFNPLLGETLKLIIQIKAFASSHRSASAMVSHHPMIVACQCEGRGWKFWGDSNLKSKFWGRSIQLDPVGVLTLELDDGEIFQWSKVRSSQFNQSVIGDELTTTLKAAFEGLGCGEGRRRRLRRLRGTAANSGDGLGLRRLQSPVDGDGKPDGLIASSITATAEI